MDEIKNVGHVSKMVRNTSRVLHPLEDSKVVSVRRVKPKLVVNIEISKDGDFCERVEGQNVLHFGS
ncbi:hypothetical protein E2C01_053505 [Portunus trituberculatus]|uniref:Uncharacterized protein n=1 Tax=Portunus trituberculatus TaxID=210409 RepID=A0A5B7GQ36_PORTR|nr:hypothetical protein [Portunus trituberculatus]